MTAVEASARLPNGLPGELTTSLISLWTKHTGTEPTHARTVIRGNVVTCVLIDGGGGDSRSTVARASAEAVWAGGDPAPVGYRREAVAAVTRLTRQRVASLVSSHDRDTDVATEVFTLEPSLRRGAPRLNVDGPSRSAERSSLAGTVARVEAR